MASTLAGVLGQLPYHALCISSIPVLLGILPELPSGGDHDAVGLGLALCLPHVREEVDRGQLAIGLAEALAEVSDVEALTAIAKLESDALLQLPEDAREEVINSLLPMIDKLTSGDQVLCDVAAAVSTLGSDHCFVETQRCLLDAAAVVSDPAVRAELLASLVAAGRQYDNETACNNACQELLPTLPVELLAEALRRLSELGHHACFGCHLEVPDSCLECSKVSQRRTPCAPASLCSCFPYLGCVTVCNTVWRRLRPP